MTNQENKKEVSMFDCGGKIAIAFLKEDGTADEVVIVSDQNIRKLTSFYFERFLNWLEKETRERAEKEKNENR
jgi:Cft2 family RNA processing exonuclease